MSFLIAFALLIPNQLRSQGLCKPDTSLHKAGYKPAALPSVKTDSQYNESISVLVKRDTFKMVGSVKVPVKIDSVKATDVIGLPSGYSYECQHPGCVFLWDTVRCVRIFGSTHESGVFPIKIAIIGYAKLGSTTIAQRDTIRDFTLVVNGPAATAALWRTGEIWNLFPQPADHSVSLYCRDMDGRQFFIRDCSGRQVAATISGAKGVYRIDTQNLPDGVYVVSDGTFSRKFVISHN